MHTDAISHDPAITFFKQALINPGGLVLVLGLFTV